MKKQKVLIIGAGPAGLTAAYELLRQSDEYEVVLLEACDTVGGISKTVFHHGNRMDLGGHRFFSKDERVMRWWQDILPLQGAPSMDDRILQREIPLQAGGPDPEVCDAVFLHRQRVSRIYYQHHFFDYPIQMNQNTIRSMGIGTTVKAGGSYLLAALHKRPEQSLEDFYINRFGKKLYSMFFEGYTEKLWGRHPGQLSADWGAQRVKGLSIRAVIQDMVRKRKAEDFSAETPLPKTDSVETSLIESFFYPKYGPGQLWEAVADRIEQAGGRIQKNCQVTKVQFQEGQNRIAALTCETEEGEQELAADLVISSMPLKDLVAGMPQVPEEIQRIGAGLPYRDFVTVGLLVDRLLLKNETACKTLGNIVPDCWIYVQDAGIKMGRIQIFNNWSPYLVKRPEETVWIGLEYFCDEGDAFWNLSEDAWKDLAVSELIKMNILHSAAQVQDYHCEKVKKAYPAYFDTYEQIGDLIKWLDQIDNLYCVGRNGQHRYNNMDHSMVTSFEAVDAILTKRSDRSRIWSVNTEQDYHEERKEE